MKGCLGPTFLETGAYLTDAVLDPRREVMAAPEDELNFVE
jgi:hypothetical protein